MKVLPTVYKGTAFRSRLEARWAMFYDELGIDWVYEPDGFQLASGVCYLPDFYLPYVGLRTMKNHDGTYIEVKPTDKAAHDQIPDGFEGNLVAVIGLPPGGAFVSGQSDGNFQIAPGWDNYMVLMVCTRCNRAKYSFNAGYQAYCNSCFPNNQDGRDILENHIDCDLVNGKIFLAAARAREWNFGRGRPIDVPPRRPAR